MMHILYSISIPELLISLEMYYISRKSGKQAIYCINVNGADYVRATPVMKFLISSHFYYYKLIN